MEGKERKGMRRNTMIYSIVTLVNSKCTYYQHEMFYSSIIDYEDLG